MGITKSDIFSHDLNTLAQLFKVLAHPARLAILEYIIKQDSCICNDLVDQIGLAQATISQHLKELKAVGIIQGTVEGKSVCYCINQEVWNQSQKIIEIFFNQKIALTKTCC